ncbi:hypothetical protein Back11_07120 [Paenibacillus baekrokdamisoli]|uniref:YhaN AAA domain-containing protein n=1 Tax=Paenibacillus baekrokdamisoli TaxID=1712516 RepID=A0A3G9IK38_9BACL|nr:AAA family ATPase [Paenibacillus baekrokdamisoli]MBB3067446.1 uncharacterized protein YhaN [Paenibacillus baekrokdamisoli]BBH19367.1 hypothetical protein Back11_07120 [Paenibacillus baekrokdamisoli]
MRWSGLHVDGFGKLHDFSCSLDAPVTIIYGPNEAGKSTTLAFIRTMLYGFATRAKLTERLEPVAGGRHGGRLFFRDESDHSFVLERYASTPTKVTIRRIEDRDEGSIDDEGAYQQIVTQAVWERQFLGGVNERVFRQLFAITLSELQAIGMLEGDELGKQLYHAGWSGGASIASTEKQLSTQLDELFRPRGSNQQINKLIKTLEQIEAQLRQLDDGIVVFNQLTEELALTEGQLTDIDKLLPNLREHASLLSRACAMRPLWLKRLVYEQEVEALELTSKLPVDARNRWESLRAECDRVQGEIGRSKLVITRLEQERDLCSFDSHLIARKDEIDALLLSAENRNALRLERRELAAEQREHGDAIERLLSRIAPGWTESHVRSLSVTIADREAIRSSREAMTESERTRSRAEAELMTLREQVREAAELQMDSEHGDRLNKVAFAGNNPFDLVPATPDTLRHAARIFEAAWRELELEQLRAEHEGAAEEESYTSESYASRSDVLLWAAAAIAAAAAVVCGVAGWHTATVAASAAAAALAAPALLRLLRQRRAARAAAPAPHGASAGAAARQAASRGYARGARQRSSAAPRAGAAAAASQAASAAAQARLVAAERRVAAALGTLVREPEATLAALLTPKAAGQGNNPGSPVPGFASESREESFVAARAYAQEAAAASDGVLALSSEAARPQQTERRFSTRSEATDSPSAAVLLERLRASIDARLDELRGYEQTALRRQELARRHARLSEQEHAQRTLLESAVNHAGKRTADWQDWLSVRSLPLTLSPEAAMETLDLAEQIMLRFQARDRITVKLGTIDAQLEAFDAAVQGLADAFPELARKMSGDSSAFLRLLSNEAQQHTDNSKRMDEYNEKLAEQELLLAELIITIERLMKQQQQWFSTAEVTSELHWLEALTQSERLHEIESELYKLDAEFKAGLSTMQRTTIEAWYSSSDSQQLDVMKAEAEAELVNAEKHKSVLLEHSGRQRERMELLLRDRDRQRLIVEREQALAGLEQLIKRYTRLSTSMTMIKRTKRIMEEQRQPAVLREASRFMAILSEDKYRRIFVPEGEQTIQVELADGRVVDSQFLSRGTAEQLYLAMRFALADEAAASADLPMILDDLFVNFDRKRLEAAVHVVQELSERRQIILLTCHDHVRDLMVDKLPTAKLVQLS